MQLPFYLFVLAKQLLEFLEQVLQYSPTILDPSLFLQRTICTLELAPGWPAKTLSTLLQTLRTEPLSMWNVRCRFPTSQLRPTAVRLQLPFLIRKTLNIHSCHSVSNQNIPPSTDSLPSPYSYHSQVKISHSKVRLRILANRSCYRARGEGTGSEFSLLIWKVFRCDHKYGDLLLVKLVYKSGISVIYHSCTRMFCILTNRHGYTVWQLNHTDLSNCFVPQLLTPLPNKHDTLTFTFSNISHLTNSPYRIW